LKNFKSYFKATMLSYSNGFLIKESVNYWLSMSGGFGFLEGQLIGGR